MSGSVDWMQWLAVGAGGAIGAVLRGLLARLASGSSARGSEPRVDASVATLAANLAACALLGAWTTIAAGSGSTVGSDPSGPLGAFVGIGVCGSLSTFSTLCADADRLARAESGAAHRSRVIGYLLAHLVGGPLALVAGAWLAG
ncbi:MAG: CrcB family protein [Myxococcota bacterium]